MLRSGPQPPCAVLSHKQQALLESHAYFINGSRSSWLLQTTTSALTVPQECCQAGKHKQHQHPPVVSLPTHRTTASKPKKKVSWET